MQELAQKFRRFALVVLIGTVFRLLRWTWRFDEEAFPVEAESIESKKESKKPIVFAHWHGDEWPLLGAFAGRHMAVLVSESEDGTVMSSLLQRLGFEVVRGSSSRGAVKGFLSLLRVIRKKKIPMVSLAVDGPRGPRHVPKEGVFGLAKAFGGGIVVASVALSDAWTFSKSWSKARLPKPFSRVVVRYAVVDAEALAASSAQKKQELFLDAFKDGLKRAEEAL